MEKLKKTARVVLINRISQIFKALINDLLTINNIFTFVKNCKEAKNTKKVSRKSTSQKVFSQAGKPNVLLINGLLLITNT